VPCCGFFAYFMEMAISVFIIALSCKRLETNLVNHFSIHVGSDIGLRPLQCYHHRRPLTSDDLKGIGCLKSL